jgi:hypothetical protein
VTIAKRPSGERGTTGRKHIFPKNGSKIFLQEAPDSRSADSTLNCFRNFRRFAYATSEREERWAKLHRPNFCLSGKSAHGLHECRRPRIGAPRSLCAKKLFAIEFAFGNNGCGTIEDTSYIMAFYLGLLSLMNPLG